MMEDEAPGRSRRRLQRLHVEAQRPHRVLCSPSVDGPGSCPVRDGIYGAMEPSVTHLEAHRVALTGHCYRMLGSAVEADDAVQETMVRAWRSLPRFEGRSSLRTWLYRVATNVCLDALSSRARRERPMETGPRGSVDDTLETLAREHWLEPIADARAIPDDVDPSERAVLRQSIRLAFVAALQELPPKQRAALLLTEVLGASAAEVAEQLDLSVAAVNSASSGRERRSPSESWARLEPTCRENRPRSSTATLRRSSVMTSMRSPR